MMNTNPPDDFPLIWQNQRREHTVMSENEIRARATRFQVRVRRNLLLAFLLGLALLFLCVVAIVQLGNLTPRVIAAAMAIVIAVITYRAYQRILWPQTVSADTGLSGCLGFYRKELTTEYRTLVLKWRLLVAIALFVWLTSFGFLHSSHLLVRILLPASLILIIFVRRHEAQKLKRELAALNAFEQEQEKATNI
jgi:hypothetical protein